MSTEAAPTSSPPHVLVQLPAHWPGQSDLFVWCQQMGPGIAALLILLGVVYLLFGFNIFKALVLLNAAAIGCVAGVMAGQQSGMEVPLGISGAFIAAAITWPMMHWAVAVMGGLFGFVVGASLWHTFGLDPRFAWSGGCIGLATLGLLSFILFRACVMMYTSFQGSVMIILGILGLLCKYQDLAPKLTGSLLVRPFILPMAVFIPTVLGMIYQQTCVTPTPAKK